MSKKIIVSVFAMISVFLTCYIIFITAPQINNLSALNRRIANEWRTANVMQKNLENIDVNKSAIEKLEEDHSSLENAILPKSKLILAILGVSDIYEEYGLDEISFRMIDIVSVDNMLSRNYMLEYKQASAEFSVSGNIDDVYRFLAAWVQTEIWYMVDGMTITGNGDVDGKVVLTANFSVFFSE